MGALVSAAILIYTSIIVVVAGEMEIANAINNAGLTGISGALLVVALPASLILYLLVQLTNQ